MPDYAKMYQTLFRSQSNAIEILQEAQMETEEMYIESEPPDIRVLKPKKSNEDNLDNDN